MSQNYWFKLLENIRYTFMRCLKVMRLYSPEAVAARYKKAVQGLNISDQIHQIKNLNLINYKMTSLVKVTYLAACLAGLYSEVAAGSVPACMVVNTWRTAEDCKRAELRRPLTSSLLDSPVSFCEHFSSVRPGQSLTCSFVN